MAVEPVASLEAPSQPEPSVGIDYTNTFIVPSSPDLPATVTYNGKLITLDEELDLIGSEDELHDTVGEDALEAVDLDLSEMEAIMETLSETEPEQGGTITPAPEMELDDIQEASAGPALTN